MGGLTKLNHVTNLISTLNKTAAAPYPRLLLDKKILIPDSQFKP